MRYPFVIVDIENTGFIGGRPAPIELAALRISPAWTVTGAFYRRWTPAKAVQPDAARKNGYTPEAWALCEPMCADDLIAFAEFVRDHRWAGASPDGDRATLESSRVGAMLPEWPLASGHAVDVLTLGAPLIRATERDRNGQASVMDALASLGLPLPPLPEWLAAMADGRTGPHTAMGDAWAAAWALRHTWEPFEEYWRGMVARRT